MNSEARRRIAVLCSHICPSHINSRNTHIVSTSNCSSESTTAQVQTRDLVKNPNSQDTCIFCQIIQGNSPAFKLYEDDTCICILDTSPLSRGHSLLIPKRHFCSLDTTHPSVVEYNRVRMDEKSWKRNMRHGRGSSSVLRSIVRYGT